MTLLFIVRKDLGQIKFRILVYQERHNCSWDDPQSVWNDAGGT
jgi:hypothetical protein